MKAPVFKVYLYVSIALLIITGGIYLYTYLMQLRERDAIFNLQSAISNTYRIQILETSISGEAFHFASTGQEHNRIAYQEEKNRLRINMQRLLSLEIDQELNQSREIARQRLEAKISRLDSLMNRPFYDNEKLLSKYIGSSEYEEEDLDISLTLTALEDKLMNAREQRIVTLRQLTKANLFGFLAVLLIAIILLIWTWYSNTRRMRMAYQLQLQQKDREFEVAFTQAPIGKIIVDQKGYCTRVNRRICEMLGYDANTLEKKRLADLSPAHEYEEDLRLIAQLMQKQEKFNEREKEMLTASGQAIWVKQSMAFVSHEDGTPQQLIIQLKDITQEKESWRKLEESNVELEQFAYMASHDLKEPIRMIDGFMKLLEKNYGDRLDETARKYVHFAADGAKRMNQLVDDLLLYSRATRQSGEPEDVELQKIMEEISKNYQPQLDKGSMDLHWHDLPQVRLPKAAIRTVLINLVSNAIKYQAPGGKPQVMVKADRVPGFWRISVVDNGIGIQSEFFDKIFIIFKRLHGKGEYEGSGIGLATCRRLVEKWGGRISVSSVEGEGSSFSFTIPAEPG